ncbi:tyrosine-type recombinase/integrase [Aliarcobacter cryaerophilus]|nr:site-specific integrase [Aliarcobacter cryaerophilus]
MKEKTNKRLEYNCKNINHLMTRAGKSKDIAYNNNYPNLVVVIRGDSRKFYSSLTIDGKTTMLLVGDCSILSIDEAFEIVLQRKRDLAFHGDPLYSKKQKEKENQEDKSSMTLNKFICEIFYPHLKTVNKRYKEVNSLIEIHILKIYKNKKLSEFTHTDLEKLITSFKEKGFQASTINLIISKAKHIFNYAVKIEYLDKSPFTYIKKLKESQKQLSQLANPELARKLIEASKEEKDIAIYYFIVIGLLTGLRRNSILNLRWDMVDLERKVITLEENKSGRTNHILLSDAAIEFFNSIPKVNDNPYVIVNQATNKPYATIFKAFSRVKQRAKLPSVTPHSLRHIYSSIYVSNGGSLYILQKLLNHSSFSTITARYAHLAEQTLYDETNKISNIIMDTVNNKKVSQYCTPSFA